MEFLIELGGKRDIYGIIETCKLCSDFNQRCLQIQQNSVCFIVLVCWSFKEKIACCNCSKATQNTRRIVSDTGSVIQGV